MEEDYNWNLILKVSAPVALIESFIFYTSISNGWKWFSLLIGLALAGIIMHAKDKKKSSIFTAVGIVFLAALIVRFMKDFGVF
ncbi:hypothetical protein HYX03_03940 [Candidatus Woesearchaeota archaeon]|nr:hypothetical protein [Candidatus Woesearchaeota archaeon]